jgi:hypothetical protein
MEFCQKFFRSVGHDGGKRFSVSQDVAKGGNSVGERHAVMVVQEKKVEAFGSGDSHQFFDAVAAVAEGGSQIEEAGHLPVGQGLSAVCWLQGEKREASEPGEDGRFPKENEEQGSHIFELTPAKGLG